MNKEDKKTTQLFVIRNILTTFCGPDFLPEKIEEIMILIEQEINDGPSSWAFK